MFFAKTTFQQHLTTSVVMATIVVLKKALALLKEDLDLQKYRHLLHIYTFLIF